MNFVNIFTGKLLSAREVGAPRSSRDVAYWQILLQKSAYRRRGTAGGFFEAIHCHPLDSAGDLRSTLLTLAKGYTLRHLHTLASRRRRFSGFFEG
jgi:hypothetical protein